MRRFVTVAVVVSSLSALAASGSLAAGAPSCLRGEWKASQAETQRVLRSLVPVPGYEVNGRLYMHFRGGAFQYGSTGLVLRNSIGDAVMTASGRFFTLAPYTARTGMLTLRAGESTIEWGAFTATKGGRTVSVPGPAPSTKRTPAGSVPFQCGGSTLKVRLPGFASLNWITLRRG
jgi:hypothetical protein